MITTYDINRITKAVLQAVGSPDELMTVETCAVYMGMTKDAIRKRCARQQIPYHKKDGHLYFSRNEVRKFYLSEDDNNEE